MPPIIPIPSSAATLPAPAITPQITYRSSLPKTIVNGSSTVTIPNLPSISQLQLKPSVEIINTSFNSNDYQGLISNSSLENELFTKGYTPISKIVVKNETGDKHAQYIKATNKNGQKVYILIDVPGYTTAKSTDLTMLENPNIETIPHSLKSGAYDCAGKDVCGVAFECGSNSVCTLVRDGDDLTPKESNFVFLDNSKNSNENSIMSYPIIRLSEIKVNPELILKNSDNVIIRLRNAAYSKSLQELASVEDSINKLNDSFLQFNLLREDAAKKLNSTITQLKKWNLDYMKTPPQTDHDKEKYRILKHNLSLRNDNVELLLRLTKKVSDIKSQIDEAAEKIYALTEFASNEFADVDKAVTE